LVFLGQKPVQTGLAWFYPGFFGLDSIWFFRFQVYKTETEPNWPVFSKF
jgi:hypothetical protein